LRGEYGAEKRSDGKDGNCIWFRIPFERKPPKFCGLLSAKSEQSEISEGSEICRSEIISCLNRQGASLPLPGTPSSEALKLQMVSKLSQPIDVGSEITQELIKNSLKSITSDSIVQDDSLLSGEDRL
jgi:hypothetical protein